jgi:hypothetical protein
MLVPKTPLEGEPEKARFVDGRSLRFGGSRNTALLNTPCGG